MRIQLWQKNLITLATSQVLSMIAFSFVFPFIPLYVQTLGVQGEADAATWAGLIGASAAISMAVMQPIWGSLSDLHGRKPMVLRSLIGAAFCLGLMGLAQTPQQLLLLRLLQGAVTGTVAASNALIASGTPRERLGYSLGVMQGALFVGTSVGPLVGGIIADTFGYRYAFYASSVLQIVGTGVVFFFCEEHFTPPEREVGNTGVLADGRALLAIGAMPVLISVIFLIQLGGTIVSPVLSLFIANLSGGENAATAAGLVLAATGAASAVAALVVGRISDRVGPRLILPICLAGAALAYFPQGLVTQTWQLLALRLLLGVSLGGLMPTANALVAGIVPREKRGAAFGLTSTAGALANAVGPISGALIASWISLRAVFFFSALLYVLGFVWATYALGRQAPAARAPGGGEKGQAR